MFWNKQIAVVENCKKKLSVLPKILVSRKSKDVKKGYKEKIYWLMKTFAYTNISPIQNIKMYIEFMQICSGKHVYKNILPGLIKDTNNLYFE